MRFIPIVSKEGFIVASLHDSVSVPSSPYVLVPYVFYAVGYGKPLYALYYIEKHELWSDLFLRIIGEAENSSNEIEYTMNLVKSIEVYMWDKLERTLKDLGESTLKLYESKRNDIIDKIKRIFGFTKLFKKAYVIFGFNPLPKRSYGSMLYFDDEKTIVAVHVNDMQRPEEILDITIHEILHGLLRLNDVELKDEIEELVIDISCPEGYLSKLIGLTSKVNISDIKERFMKYRELVEKVIAYYDYEKYREVTIIEWIGEKLNGLNN